MTIVQTIVCGVRSLAAAFPPSMVNGSDATSTGGSASFTQEMLEAVPHRPARVDRHREIRQRRVVEVHRLTHIRIVVAEGQVVHDRALCSASAET